jgi:hypothetical protein
MSVWRCCLSQTQFKGEMLYRLLNQHRSLYMQFSHSVTIMSRHFRRVVDIFYNALIIDNYIIICEYVLIII